MFCPNCGSPRKEFLYGGNCIFGCSNCGKGLHCHSIWENKRTLNDTLTIWNPIKALYLNIKYRLQNE